MGASLSFYKFIRGNSYLETFNPGTCNHQVSLHLLNKLGIILPSKDCEKQTLVNMLNTKMLVETKICKKYNINCGRSYMYKIHYRPYIIGNYKVSKTNKCKMDEYTSEVLSHNNTVVLRTRYGETIIL